MFSSNLKELPNQMVITRKMPNKARELANEHNAKIHQKFLTEQFGGRTTSCYLSTSDFWVYAQTIEEVNDIKAQAKAFGYKNLEAFVPWSGDPDNKQVDPNGDFAVRASEINDLIIGESAKKLVEFLQELVAVVEDHITFTYAHMSKVTFTLNDEVAAYLLAKSILDFFDIGAKLAGLAVIIDPIVSHTLDTFTLSVSLSKLN
jgi:hypothetical protein